MLVFYVYMYIEFSWLMFGFFMNRFSDWFWLMKVVWVVARLISVFCGSFYMVW